MKVWLVITHMASPVVFETKMLAEKSIHFSYHKNPERLRKLSDGEYHDMETNCYISILECPVFGTVEHL